MTACHVGVLSEPVRRAFDLEDESPATLDHYGQTKIGRRCLLARRLVESGARFVMVDYGYDLDYGNLWDNHNAPGQNFPHISEMCRRGYHLAGTGRACAALIRDLKERGMLPKVSLILKQHHCPSGQTLHFAANCFFSRSGSC